MSGSCAAGDVLDEREFVRCGAQRGRYAPATEAQPLRPGHDVDELAGGLANLRGICRCGRPGHAAKSNMSASASAKTR